MLKLNRLEISGFKSFLDPVQVSFAGGINAIVGPNGCGKSNLSDAITWVLGEQSAKSLRSRRMQDVIFSGTDSRQPIGMAEVSLELATDPSFEASEDGRMVISRRVFRSGESQYLLNGKKVRLKQIKDILMDTGLGYRAYSVIEQGKIGMILSGKPQERRKLLEEAAGITRYKQRKRIAEVKLEEATANLLRLDDIISEVERALRSLKRQANAARRFQVREGEYRDLLRQVLYNRWALLGDRLRELDDGLVLLTDRDAALTAELSTGEAELAANRQELDRLASELAERHQRQAELAATIEGRQEFLKGARQTLQDLAERLARGRRDAEAREQSSLDYQSSLGNLDRRAVELIAERDEAARLVAEDDAKIAAVEVQVTDAETRVEEFRRGTIEALAQVNGLRSELQREQVEIERRTFRRRHLEDEQGRLGVQLAESQRILEQAKDQVEQAESDLGERRERRQGLADTLERVLEREAQLAQERRHLETELSGQRQRRRLLIELSEEHAERRRSLIATLEKIGLPAPRFLAEELQPVEGWERGIDHFLGELSEAVVLGSGTDALAAAQALAAEGTSGIFLEPGRGAAPAAIDDPAIAYSLSEALALPEELHGALPPAYLVAAAEDARRLAAAHPGVAFISRDRLWASGGVLRIQGEEASPGVLARKSELDALEISIPQIEGKLEGIADSLQDLVAQRTRHATDMNRLDEEIAALERQSAVAQARRQDATQRHQALVTQERQVTTEQKKLSTELATASEHKRQLSDQLAKADAHHAGLADSLEQAISAVGTVKAEREALRTAGAGRRGRLELLEERLETHHQEALRVRRLIQETEHQASAWQEEEDQLDQRRKELEEAAEIAEEELQKALEKRAGAQEEVLAAQQLLDQERDRSRALEGQLAEQRDERDQLRGRIEGERVRRAGLQQDSDHQALTYLETFQRYLPGTRPPELDQETEAQELAEDPQAGASGDDPAAGGVQDAEAPQPAAAEGEVTEQEAQADAAEDGEAEDPEGAEAVAAVVLPEEETDAIERVDRDRLAELEAELARLKSLLDRMGPVNVLAASEYDEQQERHGFLTAQRTDVADSVVSLRQTIQEINATSSERFLDTFRQVNQAFGETFKRLFRGGEAYMGLLDEDDPLDTGIEIVARPPGKRPQNIMLLSGGEKALTAIALLFALFETKPSPFCILDEVDAPLDDANVLRFVDTLQEMAEQTQFIVVTHNKLTMECASTLYGVTMEERGISKLVSVRLDDIDQPAPQAATA